jgi:hypothetical protein
MSQVADAGGGGGSVMAAATRPYPVPAFTAGLGDRLSDGVLRDLLVARARAAEVRWWWWRWW